MSNQRHPWVLRLLQYIGTIFEARAFVRAMFGLVPLFILELVSGKPEWLVATIVPVAMLVALDRSRLAPPGVFAHAMAICAGVVVLLISLAHPFIFIFATVLLAMGSVLVTAGGSILNSLGNFTFISSLYLACEFAEGISPQALTSRAIEVVPFLLIAALPIMIVACVEQLPSRKAAQSARSQWLKWTRLSPDDERSPYVERMLAVACAVAFAAVLVEWRHIDHGQWMIWSAASVVTGSATGARQKYRSRIKGAIIGVSLGTLIGLMVPHDSHMRELVVFAALLTLVCIRPYTLAFGLRCACAASAFVLAGQSWLKGGERLVNVAVGSTIGLLCVLGVSVIALHVERARRSSNSKNER
jgi:uncharacterized membrane protein YqhA